MTGPNWMGSHLCIGESGCFTRMWTARKYPPYPALLSNNSKSVLLLVLTSHLLICLRSLRTVRGCCHMLQLDEPAYTCEKPTYEFKAVVRHQMVSINAWDDPMVKENRDNLRRLCVWREYCFCPLFVKVQNHYGEKTFVFFHGRATRMFNAITREVAMQETGVSVVCESASRSYMHMFQSCLT